ncbi:helix-turn-helix transcriptional regulator [Aliikangiella maris]|uniref:Metalloregulator ArsR/SmtB family transcription factor n=2 Tax=Aliikangiella maris TaxID=3162458 RepID=A0ABV2BW41_9GAMM
MPKASNFQINVSQQKLLHLIKTHGQMSATDIAKKLKMTSMGARQHMEQLEEQHYLTHHFITQGKGRPKKVWQLTEKAEALFPDGHSALIVNLLDHMQDQLGDKAMDKIIKAREKDILNRYLQEISPITDLKSKAKKLADLRTKEGYMAEVIEQEGRLLLVENHCPICAAAMRCRQFCQSELAIFKAVLECKVTRIEYILEGARRCAYQLDA